MNDQYMRWSAAYGEVIRLAKARLVAEAARRSRSFSSARALQLVAEWQLRNTQEIWASAQEATINDPLLARNPNPPRGLQPFPRAAGPIRPPAMETQRVD